MNQPAIAEQRIALVIGNSAYQNVPKLANPAKDAEAMSGTLKDAGFDVVDFKRELKAVEMRRALRDFSDRARNADIAIVYFAGHGMEIDGVNYLIPIDAMLERDIDAYDEAISLERVLAVIEPAKQLRLVILDACRDNPFANAMKRTIAARGIGRGLAKVEPTNPNTLVAFAAKAGSTALDGDSKNSPFTAALIKYLPKPGLDLRKAFGFVRDDVLKATNNKQEPFIYGSLGGEDVALVPVARAPKVADTEATVLRDYELAERVGTREAWDSFILTHPDGYYTKLAVAQRNKLAAEEARLAAADKARAAEEEEKRLAAEAVKAAEQKKAAEQTKAAEEARLAAEKKVLEQAKLVDAERAKIEAQNKANADPKEQLSALVPPEQAYNSASDKQSSADLPRLLLVELQRVGCFRGVLDSDWNNQAQKSLDLFNKNAGTKFDVKVASVEALDSVRNKTKRICPLVCDRGFKADNDICVKIKCLAGYQLNDDNVCELSKSSKPQKPVANLPLAERERSFPRNEPTTPRAQGPMPGEPAAGTIRYGERAIVRSSGCPKGQVLELIGGNDNAGIPRQRRCIAGN